MLCVVVESKESLENIEEHYMQLKLGEDHMLGNGEQQISQNVHFKACTGISSAKNHSVIVYGKNICCQITLYSQENGKEKTASTFKRG